MRCQNILLGDKNHHPRIRRVCPKKKSQMTLHFTLWLIYSPTKKNVSGEAQRTKVLWLSSHNGFVCENSHFILWTTRLWIYYFKIERTLTRFSIPRLIKLLCFFEKQYSFDSNLLTFYVKNQWILIKLPRWVISLSRIILYRFWFQISARPGTSYN